MQASLGFCPFGQSHIESHTATWTLLIVAETSKVVAGAAGKKLPNKYIHHTHVTQTCNGDWLYVEKLAESFANVLGALCIVSVVLGTKSGPMGKVSLLRMFTY